MAKLAIAILVFRGLQAALSLTFFVFWTWACAAGYAIGGGAGEYFLGYFTSLVSLAVCGHGIWSFVKKQHLAEHRALYHNARWAVDLLVVGLWLGVILLEILVSVPGPRDGRRKQLFGFPSDNPSAPRDTVAPVIEPGVTFTQLFSAITFFMTALLLVFPAVKARSAKTTTGVGE